MNQSDMGKTPRANNHENPAGYLCVFIVLPYLPVFRDLFAGFSRKLAPKVIGRLPPILPVPQSARSKHGWVFSEEAVRGTTLDESGIFEHS